MSSLTMDARDVTPQNLHLAVAVLLDRQGEIVKKFDAHSARFDEQDKVLLEIRTQTIKTNGRVLAAEADIKELKGGVKDALAKACPGKCIDLEVKVRSLEDSRLSRTSTEGGIKWALGAVWAAGGVAASAVVWFLSR